MAQDSQELRRDIEQTRTHLGTTLDSIGERVMPSRIVERRKNRMRERFGSIRDSVMGSAGSVQSSVSDGAHHVADTVGSAAGSIGNEVREAPTQIADQARGNPLAAGLVAFGIGMIVATVIPASRPEEQAAVALKDKLEPLQEQAKQIGSDMKDAVQESARDAAEQVKSRASEAVQDVKSDASDAATDLKDHAGQAAGDVRDQTRGGDGAFS
jgi:gas vesicle protein